MVFCRPWVLHLERFPKQYGTLFTRPFMSRKNSGSVTFYTYKREISTARHLSSACLKQGSFSNYSFKFFVFAFRRHYVVKTGNEKNNLDEFDLENMGNLNEALKEPRGEKLENAYNNDNIDSNNLNRSLNATASIDHISRNIDTQNQNLSESYDQIILESFSAYIQKGDQQEAKNLLRTNKIRIGYRQIPEFLEKLKPFLPEPELIKTANSILLGNLYPLHNDMIHMQELWKSMEYQEIINIYRNKLQTIQTPLSETHLLVILAAFVKSKDLKGAHEFIKEQNINTSQIDQLIYLSLSKYLNPQELENLKRFIANITRESVTKLKPNTPEFSFTLTRVFKANNWQLALNIYDDLVKNGTKLNEFTYATFLKGFLMIDRFDEAMMIWKDLVNSGQKPSAVLYNSVIIGFARRRNTAIVEKLWNSMLKDNIKPDAHSYSAIIECYFRSRETKKAAELYLQMSKAKIQMDIHGYNRIINGLLWNNLPDTALDLYKAMQKGSVPPNIVTYNTLIRGLMYAKRWQELIEVIKDMRKAKHTMDAITLTTFLERFFAIGDVESAKSIIPLFALAGVQPTAVTYGALISGLIRCRDFDGAQKALEEMIEQGLYPGIQVLTNMIQGLIARGKINTAENLYNTLYLTPNNAVLNIMIAGYMDAGDPKKAMTYFDRMLKLRIKPTKDTYFIVINGLMMYNEWEMAYKIYDQMIEDGFRAETGALSRLCEQLLIRRNM
ncbi:14170_t:CDS:1, partial [Ambispora leptoticha]